MEVNDVNSEEHDSEERECSLDVDQAPSPADKGVEWTISKSKRSKIQNQRYLDGKSRKAYQLSVSLSQSFEGTDGWIQELDHLSSEQSKWVCKSCAPVL